MARELRDLPRRQRREDLLRQRTTLGLEMLDLFGDVELVVVADMTQLFDLRLEFSDRLFEREEV
jgi:hypothetical protein